MLKITAVVILLLTVKAEHSIMPTGVSVLDEVSVLYNNDGENLWAVNSSYHPCVGCAVDTKTIRGSALDVADIADVDLICPFHNVPWWNSALEPPQAHRNWYDTTFGFPWGAGGSQLDYVLKGGDFIGEFADASLSSKQKPFITIRLNDGQMCSHPPTPDNCTSGSNNDHQFDRLSQFWYENRANSSMILGLQESPPQGFKDCCWKQGSEKCSCSNTACEFSWSSPLARDRIAALVGEVAGMYIQKGVRGISLDFERGLDYFSSNISPSTRESIMMDFVRDIRQRIDAVSKPLNVDFALGVRLTPSQSTLAQQGLSNLTKLVTPVENGGAGVTYINWGVFFWAYQPFDSELESLVAMIPHGVPWFFETTSWIGQGLKVPNCSNPPKVRVTKEEIWTTALLSRFFGGSGISAFNFVYTRPFFDVPCEFEINKPYSEPLFFALNQTKDVNFLKTEADQLYRLDHTRMGSGQIASQYGKPNPSYNIVTVKPSTREGLVGQWVAKGRLRVLLGDLDVQYEVSQINDGPNITAFVNGHRLPPTSNVSSLYHEGIQAAMAIFPPSMWRAFDVPSNILNNGNNTFSFNISSPGGGGEANYKLVYDGASGDGKRWRFPYPYTSSNYKGPRVEGSSFPNISLLDCEKNCDADAACTGIYHSDVDGICYTYPKLIEAGTTRYGSSYAKSNSSSPIVISPSDTETRILRLEVALPVETVPSP